MPSDATPPRAPDLLSALRAATGSSHEQLDAGFGALDLQRQDDLARFLRAHALGLAPLFATFRRVAEVLLALPCPDYPAMLRADLAALGKQAPESDAAEISPDGADAAAGIAYVVAGSRLGLTVIRQRGYWGAEHGFRSAYMEDTQAHAVWKALVPMLRGRSGEGPEADAACAAALGAFGSFSRAFAASGIQDDVRQGMNG